MLFPHFVRSPKTCKTLNFHRGFKNFRVGGGGKAASVSPQSTSKTYKSYLRIYRGDYESALVLYHRAAQLNPGNVNHLVGARRASDAITASVNPDEKLGRLLRESRSPGQMSALVCPEAAARRARAIVAQSDEPVQDIPRILKCVILSRKLFNPNQ